MIEHSPIAFYTCNLQGEITYYNKSAEELILPKTQRKNI